MPCVRVEHGFICGPKVYEYKGYSFEWHSYCGPSPLKKNGEPSQRIPKGFWDMIDDFCKLDATGKEQFRV